MINNEEEEGKGRSTKRPRERLKFQIFPTVVALLSLEQWRNAHGANRPDVRRVSNFCVGQWTRSKSLWTRLALRSRAISTAQIPNKLIHTKRK